MSQTAVGPEWTRNGSCKPRYIWHIDNTRLQTGKYNQAARITLARRQVRSKNSRVEPELYACKWYSTAGLGETGHSGSSISSLKYVQREAAAFASINHPNVVRFQDFHYELGKAQLARLYMEYCPRGDLSQFSRRASGQTDPRMSCHEGAQVLNQLAQALLYLHHGVFKADDVLKLAKLDFDVFKVEDQFQAVNSILRDFESAQSRSEWKTILHRDVKPANVFVAERASGMIKVKLGDFGLAKFETDGTDTYVGSREYFAPEQRTACENQRTTFKSDIYALGVTMKEVTRTRDASHLESATTMDAAVESVLSRCVEVDDTGRLSSLAIVDELRQHLSNTKSEGNLLSDAVHQILIFDTEGNSNKRKRLRVELEEMVFLCRRLLEAGSDPNLRIENEASVLDLANGFINDQLEVLGLSQAPGKSPCPAWKLSMVESLADILTDNDAHGSVQRYNIGRRSCESFCAESKSRRMDILLEVLESRNVTKEGQIKPKVMTWLAKNMHYKQLLKFTIDDHALAAEVTKAETNLGRPLPRTVDHNIPHEREHELHRWNAGADVGHTTFSLEDSGRPYRDQFFTLEPTHPFATSYDKNGYYAQIDRPFKQQEKRAARILREIEGGASVDPDSAEERWQDAQRRNTVIAHSTYQTRTSPEEDTAAPRVRLPATEPQDLIGSKATSVALGTPEAFVRDRVESFKQFANAEKLRLRRLQEQKRTEQGAAEMSAKLNDLKKFSREFKLESAPPEDLLPILSRRRSKCDSLPVTRDTVATPVAAIGSRNTSQHSSEPEGEDAYGGPTYAAVVAQRKSQRKSQQIFERSNKMPSEWQTRFNSLFNRTELPTSQTNIATPPSITNDADTGNKDLQKYKVEYAQHQPVLRREPTKTISPKDAMLDYLETDQQPLLQDPQPPQFGTMGSNANEMYPQRPVVVSTPNSIASAVRHSDLHKYRRPEPR